MNDALVPEGISHISSSAPHRFSCCSSSVQSIVLHLIIDDSYESRGNRRNLLSEEYQIVGISFNSITCNVVFASNYIPKSRLPEMPSPSMPPGRRQWYGPGVFLPPPLAGALTWSLALFWPRFPQNQRPFYSATRGAVLTNAHKVFVPPLHSAPPSGTAFPSDCDGHLHPNVKLGLMDAKPFFVCLFFCFCFFFFAFEDSLALCHPLPATGRPEICWAGGGGGEPQDGWGGGFGKWAPESKGQICFFLPYADGWKFFFEKVFTSLVCVQNDQRIMGMILRYVCWDTPPPPALSNPPQADLGAHGGGEGGGQWAPPPPPLSNFLPVQRHDVQRAGSPPPEFLWFLYQTSNDMCRLDCHIAGRWYPLAFHWDIQCEQRPAKRLFSFFSL